jgi:hypothetical protein
MALVLTTGQRGDSPCSSRSWNESTCPALGPGRPRNRPLRVLADKAYPSRANRAYLRKRGIQAVIPEKKDQRRHRKAKGRNGGRPPAFDREASRSATPSSGPSAASSAIAASRPGSTSSPSATKPPSK